MTLSDLLLVRRTTSMAAAAAWTAVGAASVATAMAVAFRDGFQLDLWTVREWLASWRAGQNPYAVHGNLDYPPNALWMLWPFGTGSDAAASVAVAVTAVVSAGAATVILLRWCAERIGYALDWRAVTALVGMMYAGAAMRGVLWRGQTAPVAFLLGALALRWATTRPVAAAVALALCAFKPHVAVGFALAIVLTASARVVLGAAIMVAVKAWLFAVSIGEPLPLVLDRYAAILLAWYESEDAIPGLLSIRWVLADAFGSHAVSTTVFVVAAAGALAALIVAARRGAEGPRAAVIAAACLLWALLFLPHQLYHGWMWWPALWLVMWLPAMIPGSGARLAIVGVVLAIGVLDVPRLLRWGAESGGHHTVAHASYYLLPVMLAVLLLILVAGLMRGRARTAEIVETLH